MADEQLRDLQRRARAGDRDAYVELESARTEAFGSHRDRIVRVVASANEDRDPESRLPSGASDGVLSEDDVGDIIGYVTRAGNAPWAWVTGRTGLGYIGDGRGRAFGPAEDGVVPGSRTVVLVVRDVLPWGEEVVTVGAMASSAETDPFDPLSAPFETWPELAGVDLEAARRFTARPGGWAGPARNRLGDGFTGMPSSPALQRDDAACDLYYGVYSALLAWARADADDRVTMRSVVADDAHAVHGSLGGIRDSVPPGLVWEVAQGRALAATWHDAFGNLRVSEDDRRSRTADLRGAAESSVQADEADFRGVALQARARARRVAAYERLWRVFYGEDGR